MSKPISKPKILKEYFSIPERPVTGREIIDLKKTDPKGFDEIVTLVKEELNLS